MSLRILLARPVGVLLGTPEAVYLLSPLRPVDLADLESLAFATWPNPAESLPRGNANTPEHRQALRDALDAAEAGPPSWNGSANPVLATTASVTLLRACLRDHPGMTEEILQSLASQMTSEHWKRVYRVAWGIDPAREIIQRIDDLLGFPPEPMAGVPWARAIADLAETTGWTLDAITHMSLAAINLMRNGGKPIDPWDSGPEEPISEMTPLSNGLQAARARFFEEADHGR